MEGGGRDSRPMGDHDHVTRGGDHFLFFCFPSLWGWLLRGGGRAERGGGKGQSWERADFPYLISFFFFLQMWYIHRLGIKWLPQPPFPVLFPRVSSLVHFNRFIPIVWGFPIRFPHLDRKYLLIFLSLYNFETELLTVLVLTKVKNSNPLYLRSSRHLVNLS